MPAQIYCLPTSLSLNNVIFFFTKMMTLKNYFVKFDVGTAINESEYRTMFATRSGGLWWISPAFLEDLIYRRGRTVEEIENFDRLDHEHDLEIEAARNKEAMLVALPWDQRPAGMSTMLMRYRQVQLKERTSKLHTDERVR